MIYNNIEMTEKEAEKLAYISGDVEIAKLLSVVINLENELSEVNYRLAGLQ